MPLSDALPASTFAAFLLCLPPSAAFLPERRRCRSSTSSPSSSSSSALLHRLRFFCDVFSFRSEREAERDDGAEEEEEGS